MSDKREGRDEYLVAAEFQFDAHHMAAEIIRLRTAEAAAFRRGAEAMRKGAVEEINRLYFAEAEPTQQAYDRQDAFHCADRAIAALPPPEDKP